MEQHCTGLGTLRREDEKMAQWLEDAERRREPKRRHAGLRSLAQVVVAHRDDRALGPRGAQTSPPPPWPSAAPLPAASALIRVRRGIELVYAHNRDLASVAGLIQIVTVAPKCLARLARVIPAAQSKLFDRCECAGRSRSFRFP